MSPFASVKNILSLHVTPAKEEDAKSNQDKNLYKMSNNNTGVLFWFKHIQHHPHSLALIHLL